MQGGVAGDGISSGDREGNVRLEEEGTTGPDGAFVRGDTRRLPGEASEALGLASPVPTVFPF